MAQTRPGGRLAWIMPFTAAALVGLLAVGLLAPVAGASARTKPRIFVAHRAAPVGLPVGSWAQIGSLKLPEGRWALLATLTLENTSASGIEAACQLKLGTAEFVLQVFPMIFGGPVPITLMTAGRSPGGSRAVVRCVAYGSPLVMEARDLEILAIRAGKVTTVDMSDGSSSTVGRSNDGVRVVSGLLDGARTAGNPGYDTVAQLPVPAGEWVYLLSANAASQTGVTGSVECRLLAEGDFDVGQVRLEKQGFTGASQGLTLAVAHSSTSAMVAKLSCWSEVGANDVAIGDTQVLALRAGRLTNRGGGGEWTLGVPENGPRMLVGWDNGPDPIGKAMSTVGSLDLPSGAWAGFAKTWAQRTSGLTADASCVVRFAGSPAGRTTAGLLATGVGNAATDHTLASAAASDSATSLVARCAGGPAAGDVSSRFLKMVAIRGASVTRRAA